MEGPKPTGEPAAKGKQTQRTNQQRMEDKMRISHESQRGGKPTIIVARPKTDAVDTVAAHISFEIASSH